MTTLILRATTSALYFQFIQKKVLASGSFQRIAGATYFSITHDEEYSEAVRIADHRHALRALIDHLHRNSHIKALLDISTVIYRINHGGDEFQETTLLRKEELHRLERIRALTPEGGAIAQLVAAGLNQLPSAQHVGVFDTAFYRLAPESQYALQPRVTQRLHIKRYGFNGIVHKAAYDARKAQRVISVHIDDDVSVTAIRNGVGIDTTTGFTVAEGLPGLHRSGSVDPRIPLYMAAHLRLTPQQIDTLLSTKSGLAALTGRQSYAEIIAGARKKDVACINALMMLCYRIGQEIAAMSVALGGVDHVVLSGDGARKELVDEISRRIRHITRRIRIVSLDETNILLAEARTVSRTFKKKRRIAR